MADKKISQLPAATTPLAGTEVFPIVQNGITCNTPVSNLLAGRYIIGIPFVYASSGTMGDNGALSGIAAVNSTYANAYVYLPANAIAAGSTAGWYYAVFSSTTAATVYNNKYTTGVPSVPASPTAFVTTGLGAYTQANANTGPTIVLPANTLSVNGRIEIDAYCTQTSGNAFIAMNVGTLYFQSNGTTTWTSAKWAINARGTSTGLMGCTQFTSANYNATTSYGNDSLASTITISPYIRSLSVATTSATLEQFCVKIYP